MFKQLSNLETAVLHDAWNSLPNMLQIATQVSSVHIVSHYFHDAQAAFWRAASSVAAKLTLIKELRLEVVEPGRPHVGHGRSWQLLVVSYACCSDCSSMQLRGQNEQAEADTQRLELCADFIASFPGLQSVVLMEAIGPKQASLLMTCVASIRDVRGLSEIAFHFGALGCGCLSAASNCVCQIRAQWRDML